MNSKLKKLIRPALFIMGGALAGLVYYYAAGCATGSCPITANPVRTVLYTAFIGWLLSVIFAKEDKERCNM